jgi:hypothetical protein
VTLSAAPTQTTIQLETFAQLHAPQAISTIQIFLLNLAGPSSHDMEPVRLHGTPPSVCSAHNAPQDHTFQLNISLLASLVPLGAQFALAPPAVSVAQPHISITKAAAIKLAQLELTLVILLIAVHAPLDAQAAPLIPPVPAAHPPISSTTVIVSKHVHQVQ